MNVLTFSLFLVASSKSCEELAVPLFPNGPLSGSVQAPADLFVRQGANKFLWVSDELIAIPHSNIPEDWEILSFSERSNNRRQLDFLLGHIVMTHTHCCQWIISSAQLTSSA